MRIENISSETLESMSDADLRYMRSRCLNIFDRYFARSDVRKAVGMDRRFFLTRYLLLRSEMENRGMKFFRERPLDEEVHTRITQASIWKLDVPALGDMVAIPNYVSVCGEFIKSPVAVEKIDVVIRTAEEHRNEVFEAKIGELVKEQTNKDPNFIYEPMGPDKSYIPLFDLVLKSHEETRKIRAKKNALVETSKKPIDISVEKLSVAQRKECDEETEKIKENEKLPEAAEHHEFKAAKFTHPNGHPRCLVCGDEEPIGKVCNMPESWYKKYEWDDEKAWTEERKRLKASGKLKKLFPIEKPEETENTIRIPVGPECEVTATITIDKGQGISALYCGKIKKIRTYQFDKRVKAWTMASARAWIKEHPEKTEKLSDAQRKECDEETEKIRENKKTDKYPHKFEPAKYTHPNGHPRCIHCGQEEREDKKGKLPCSKPVTKFTIIKIDKEQQIVGGIIYEPDEVDTQDDYTDAKEIEKAMYRFMEKYATDAKRIRIDHKGKRYFFPIMEVFQAEEDTKKGGQILKAGTWWLEIKVMNANIWKMIENKELEGFSMGGSAKG